MADHILDKAFLVLPTYNSSATAGVTAFRCVKWTTTGIDLEAAATAGDLHLGVVQENIDAAKVATGKAFANVRLLGVTWVYVAASGTAPVVGDRVVPATGGGVVKAAVAGNRQLGIVVGAQKIGQTIANGDLVEVLLTPGVQWAS